jgi:hypothetical protein
MKTNNKVTLLVVIIIILSIGLTATALKLFSLERKIDNIDTPMVEEPTVNEPIIVKPLEPEEPPIVVEPEEPTDPPKVEEPPVIQEPDKVIVKPKYITKDQAIQIGINKVGDGAKLIEIESDLDDNPPKYELEIQLGNYEYELEIHAITGSIIDFEKDEIDD